MGQKEKQSRIDSINGSVANTLKKRRLEMGYSIQELSQQSGISRSSIRRIEEAERQPTTNTLLFLCDALEVPCWKVLKTSEDAQKNPIKERDAFLPDDLEKAFLKLRKRCLSKPELGEAVTTLVKSMT